MDGLLDGLRERVIEILPRWGMSSPTLELLSISENVTFLATDCSSGGRMVMRVQRPRYNTEAEIVSELGWIDALRSDGIVVTARPIPTIDHALVVGVEFAGERRRVVAFEYLPGTAPVAPADLVASFRRLGEITARMHVHGRGWQRPANFHRRTWNYETTIGQTPAWGTWQAGLGLAESDLKLLGRVAVLLKAQVSEYESVPGRIGLIHGDMRPANLLVDGPRLAVIDFDDCGTSWFAFDFAASVGLQEHEPFIPEAKAAWLEGYREVSAFSEAEERALDIFMMVRRMQMTGWLASHLDTEASKLLGHPLTSGTVLLGERYLAEHC